MNKLKRHYGFLFLFKQCTIYCSLRPWFHMTEVRAMQMRREFIPSYDTQIAELKRFNILGGREPEVGRCLPFKLFLFRRLGHFLLLSRASQCAEPLGLREFSDKNIPVWFTYAGHVFLPFLSALDLNTWPWPWHLENFSALWNTI